MFNKKAIYDGEELGLISIFYYLNKNENASARSIVAQKDRNLDKKRRIDSFWEEREREHTRTRGGIIKLNFTEASRLSSYWRWTSFAVTRIQTGKPSTL